MVSLSRKLMACCINQVEQIIIFSVSYRQLFSGQSHQLCSVTVKKPASPVGFFTSFVSAKSARHARHTGETHTLNLNQPSQLCRLLKKLAHSVR
uniref:Uncharacterized protein n=1 Tax=Klebsiella pneumoniae TaxID=573 RepID=A0A2L1KL80_KLEPN|nr:hypothetical protein [Klebsiella pneumoniae]QJR99677.1 hypothetical protein [Klebsiella pneumoniae]